MLATELQRPRGPNMDAGRSRGPSFYLHTTCRSFMSYQPTFMNEKLVQIWQTPF